MANAPWKTYGGIHKASYLNNLSVYSFTADVFTLRQSVYGMFDICGELHVSGNASIDSNIIGNNLIIHNDITTNRLFVNEKTIHYDDTDISGGNLLIKNGNVTVRGGSVYLLENMDVSGHIYLRNELYLGNSFNAFLYGTDTVGNIGINTRTPIATLDISSQYPLAFNVGTNVNSQIYSIPLQNNRKRGILLSANDTVSKIGFYNDASLSSVTSTPDAYIQYNSGGTLTLDASQNLNLASNVSITNRPANTDAHVMGETLVVYDTSSGPYLYPVYENPASATGNAISLISNDLSSNTFMNIIAPNKQGISIGGGAYPNDSKRSMGLIGWRDGSANYTPSINIVSGTSNLRQKSTIGINTHSPETETYAFDVNGPTHIKNGELTITNQADFEIRVLTTGRSAPKNGIAIGTPYRYDASNVNLFKYKHKILYTVDGGENWYSNLDTSGDEFEKSDHSYRSAYVYDSSLSIIACDGGVAYYTGTGYLPINGNEVWQSIGTPATLLTQSIRAVYVGAFTNIKRAFFGLSPSSEIYWFNLPNDIYTDINGFASNASGNAFGTVTVGSAGIQAIDGCGNSMWILCGNSIFKGVINVTPPTTALSYTNVQNSENYTTLSVYDTNNIIAAGKNIITYTKNGGTTWTNFILNGITVTNFPLNGITVNKVIACDAFNAIAVCNAGIILTSTDGYASWSILSSNALNVSGNAKRITDPSYNLNSIAMVNTNHFFIAKVIKAYQTGAPPTLGNTSIFHAHIPNVFNNVTNFVLDISGSVRLSGDMNVNDGGKIGSNNSTFRLLDTGVNRINVGGEAASVYIGNAAASKVVMNYDLNVLHDASINGNITVNRVVQSAYYEGLNSSSNISIGGIYNVANQPRTIKIGNFNTSPDAKNLIMVSGANDKLVLNGDISLQAPLNADKIIVMNATLGTDPAFPNLSTAAGSGLWFADCSLNNRGFFLVSEDLGGYAIRSVGKTNTNVIKLDVSNLIVPPTQNTALPFLYTTPASVTKDSNYTLGVCPIDPSNIMIINKYKSNLPSQQTVDTSFSVIGPMSIGMATANPNYVIEISGNSHVMGNTITFDTSNTVVNNAMSIGKAGFATAGYCLDVCGNAYFSGGNLIIYDKIGIGKTVDSGTNIILDTLGNVRLDGTLNRIKTTNTIFENMVSIGKTTFAEVGYILDVSGGVKIDGSNVTIKSNSTIVNNNVSIGTTAAATPGLILDVNGGVKIDGSNVTIKSNSTIVNNNMSIGKPLARAAAASGYNLDVCGNVQIDGGNVTIRSSNVIAFYNMSVGRKAQADDGYILDVYGNVQIEEGKVSIQKNTHGNIFIAEADGLILDVSGGVKIDGSNVTINSSNTIVKNNMSIGKPLARAAAASGYNLDVCGNVQMDGGNVTIRSSNTIVNNNMSIGKTTSAATDIMLDVNGNVKMAGGNVSIASSNTIVNNNMSIGKTTSAATDIILDVNGNVKMAGGNVTIASSNTIVNNNMSIGKPLNAAAASGYNLDVCGNVQMDGGNVTIRSSNTIVNNNMSIGKTTAAATDIMLDVNGNVKMAGGNVSIASSNTIVNNNMSIGKTTAAATDIMLDVNGNVKMAGGNVSIASSNTIVNNNMSIGKPLNAAAASGYNLDVCGNVQIDGGNVTIRSNNTIINNPVSIGKPLNAAAASGYNLDVCGNVQMDGNNVTIRSNNTIINNPVSIGKPLNAAAASGYNLDVCGNVQMDGNNVTIRSNNTIINNPVSIGKPLNTAAASGYNLDVCGNVQMDGNNVTIRSNNTIINKTVSIGKSTAADSGLTLDVTGNAAISANLTANGITISANGLSVSGIVSGTTNCLVVNGNIRYGNVIVQRTSTITVLTPGTLSYPLSQSYDIKTNGDTTIPLPAIDANIIGATINFYKSASATITVTINPHSSDRIVKNGSTVQTTTFSLESSKTSTTLLACAGTPNYWVEIGSGVGKDLTLNGNLTVSGTGNIQYRNLLVQRNGIINGNTQLSYPLSQTYDIQTSAATSITLPAIDATILGSTINFYKSTNKSIVVTINRTSPDTFIKNGSIDKTTSFSLIDGTTSTTLLASGTSGAYYWVEIGAGGGGGNTFTTGLNVSGTSSAAGYTANISGNVIATSYNATSDRRLKTNVTPLYSQWNAILRINPVSFDWIEDGRPDIGFIAQEIHAAYPLLRPNHKNIDLSKSTIEEPIDLSGNPLYYAIDYGRMTPFLWQGMREIMQRMEQLEHENAQFKERIRILEERA